MPLDVMVDLETLGNGPDAVILSIGAVAFDASGRVPLRPDSARADGHTFYTAVDIDANLVAGRTVSGGAIKFWLEQDETARRAILVAPLSLEPALIAFKTWLYRLDPGNAFRGQMWAWPPSFDLVIIHSALTACGIAPAWKRRNERDARTLCMAIGVHTPDTPAPTYGTKHHALHDAIGQAILVQQAATAIRVAFEGAATG